MAQRRRKCAVTSWTVRSVALDHPDAVDLVRTYLADIIGRYHSRPATPDEIDTAIEEDPTGDLVGFFVADWAGTPSGCVGFRLVDPTTAELKRLFMAPHARGRGGGAVLLKAVEDAAAGLGARSVRLDTRGDLVEARSLYAKHGYREVPRFNDDRYAEHWFAKSL
jgi:GNAT superfamily N-acetyltransferase